MAVSDSRRVADAHEHLVAAKRNRDRDEIAAARRQLQLAIDAARDSGTDWSQIGEALGIRRGNAYQRFGKRAASANR